MQKLMPINKKGQVGLNLAKSVLVLFLILAVLGIAVILALVSLRDSNIFTENSQDANDTTNIVANVTGGVTEFFSNTTTVFSILIVVVIISAIGIVIYVVTRFGSGGGGGL
jgi:multidrug resistance efflux pump